MICNERNLRESSMNVISHFTIYVKHVNFEWQLSLFFVNLSEKLANSSVISRETAKITGNGHDWYFTICKWNFILSILSRCKNSQKLKIHIGFFFRTWWIIWKIPFQTINKSWLQCIIYQFAWSKKMKTLNWEISIVQEFVMGLLLLLLLLKQNQFDKNLLWILIY